MVDPQEPPEQRPEGAPSADPAKAVKKTPAKKAPVKKAPAKAVKKAPAKKAPAKKAPAKKAAPPPPEPAPDVVLADPLPSTNGVGPVREGAKEVAAQAKSTVEQATDSVAAPVLQPVAHSRSPLPLVVALAVSLLAFLVVRQLRRHSDED